MEDFNLFGYGSIEERDREEKQEWFWNSVKNFHCKYRHTQVLECTMRAIEAGLPLSMVEPEILKALREKGGREEQPNEIKNAYNSWAVKARSGNHKTGATSWRWHQHDPVKAKKFLENYEKGIGKLGINLYSKPDEFTKECPSLLKEKLEARRCVQTLFPEGDPMLCLAKAVTNFHTDYLSNFSSLAPYQHLCPNRYTKLKGRKASACDWLDDKDIPEEDWSAHTKDNVGPKEYQVVEFDDSPIEYQCRAISFLRKFLPLAMVMFSGNKSLHAWFAVRNDDAEYVRDFFNLACCLGADATLWEEYMFARMPNVYRNDSKARGVLQEVYFIAHPDEQTICPLSKGMHYDIPLVSEG